MLAFLLPSLAAAAPAEPSSVGAEVEPLDVAGLRTRLFGASARPRLANFWATGGGPGVRERPRTAAWDRVHRETEVVLVDSDLASLRDSKGGPFLDEHGVVGTTLLQLDDPDPAMAMKKLVPDWSDVVPLTLFVT